MFERDPDCIFCKIAAGEVPAKVVLENEHCVVFEDVNPFAPVHLLIIPRQHIPSLNDASQAPEVLAACMTTAAEAAKKLGVADSGYRVIMNVNRDGGQEVFHLHAHLMGGRKLGWPAG